MSIRNRYRRYISKVTQGYARPGQLLNLSRSLLMPKGEVVSWEPTHLSFFSTSRCNFQCDMCPTHSAKIPKDYIHRHREGSDMFPDLLRLVLDRYPNVMALTVIGVGEPLLNPHFFDLIEECEKRRMIVGTVSNGYRLDAYIPDIVRSGLNRFCISVNGHTEEEFHRMTGMPKKNHYRILRNVEALVCARGNKKYPLVDVSFIIDRHNYRYMGNMIEVGEKLRADTVIFCHFLPSPYPGFSPEERCVYADDPAVLEEFTRLMSRKYSCEVKWPHLLSGPGGKRTVCKWPFKILIVDGGGNVGGCPAQMLNIHGNGKVTDENPWNGEYFRDLRRRQLQGDLLWPCKYCVEAFGVEPNVAGAAGSKRTARRRIIYRKRPS